jgi:O-antigen/teichoic acid export membrane protein
MLIMLAVSAVAARSMMPDEFGLFLAGTNIVVLLSLVGMAGLNQSLIPLIAGQTGSTQSRSKLLIRCLHLTLAVSGIVSLVFAFSLSSTTRDWLGCDYSLIQVMIVCALLVSAHKLLSASLRSLHWIANSGLLEGRMGGPVANSVFLILLLTLFRRDRTAADSLWMFVVSMAVTLPLGFWLLRRALHTTKPISLDDTGTSDEYSGHQHLFWFSLPFMLTQILAFFSTDWCILLAKFFTSGDSTALFGGAMRITQQILAPMQILTLSIGSSIAELQRQGRSQQLQSVLAKSAILGCAATIPALLVCVSFPGPVMHSLYGDFYRSGAPLLALLCLGQAVNCWTGQCGYLLMFTGWSKTVLAIRTVFALSLVALGSWAAKEDGVWGLTVVVTAVAAAENITLWLLARGLTGYWTHASMHSIQTLRRTVAKIRKYKGAT